MYSPTPTQDDILTTLRSFLLAILPSGTDVILAQVNRVPEPSDVNFVIMTPIRRRRLATNITEADDVAFTGSIAGTTLTVSAVEFGALSVGFPVFGVDVAAGTIIASLGTGTGGVGTYTVSPSQTITSRTLAAGVSLITQKAEFAIQLDVHGPQSADSSATITTLMRDGFAVDAFAASNVNIAPLYADDGRQIAFQNAEQQWEDRWVIEALLQADQTLLVPQQYATVLSVDILNVDAVYPL